MYREILDHLNLRPGQRIVDCTAGTGGHALGIAAAIGPSGYYIGIDRDADSLHVAQNNVREFADHCCLVHDDFRNIDTILDTLHIRFVDGIIFDLGISSYQLDSPERGFSIKYDGPLDMRMDKNSYISAYDLINSLSEREISAILKNFGQERWHHRIANRLVHSRVAHPITSTSELSQAVIKAIPNRYQHQKIHPATRTFQAFRIAVNRELEALEIALDKSAQYLKKGARICVISFHSLEDKIVKEKFRHFAKEGVFALITKKPARTSDDEMERNPRSRSARLRVAEKIK